MAERIAAIASDRKAIDIRLVDLRGIVAYTDSLVVCSGNTERQTKAIHDAIHRELKDDTGCCRAASRASVRRVGSSWTTSTASRTCPPPTLGVLPH